MFGTLGATCAGHPHLPCQGKEDYSGGMKALQLLLGLSLLGSLVACGTVKEKEDLDASPRKDAALPADADEPGPTPDADNPGPIPDASGPGPGDDADIPTPDAAAP